MAEIDLIKISELPATSTIGDADELAVVQGGATKKVPYSALKAGAEVTPDTTLSEAGVPADAAAVGAALALKANQAAVTQALAAKADKTEVTDISGDIAELASVVETKADQTALNQKADKTTTDALRQDLTTLNGIVNQKADKTELNTQIGNVTAELATKANTADVNNLLAAKANVASPVFTGRPQAPTAPKGTATLQLATTAFVQNAIDDKQDTLTFDTTPTEGSANPVTSGGVWEAVQTDKTLAIEDKAADAKATGNVIAELKNDLVAANAGRETFALYADFVNGTQENGSYKHWYKFRVTCTSILSFDRDLVLTIENGFRIFLALYTDGQYTSNTPWATETYTIPRNTTFKIVIGRVPEDSSETANVSEFVNAVVFDTIENVRTKNVDFLQENTDFIMDTLDDNYKYTRLESTLESGKLLGANGQTIDISSTDWNVSDYIDVSRDTYIWIEGSTGYTNLFYAKYTADKTFISGEASGGEISSISKMIYVGDASYIKYSKFKSDLGDALRITGLNLRKWSGKKWVCIGDSLTQVNSATTKHYFDYVSEETGISTVNYGVGGTGYANPNGTAGNFVTRMASVPTDGDVYTIFGSFNDWQYSIDNNLPIGNPTDEGRSSLCGYFNAALDALFTRIPLANLGVVAPCPWAGINAMGTGTFGKDYTDALKAVCERRSVPFLNLYTESGMRPWDTAFREQTYTKDSAGGVHPDETGHAILAPKFEAFLDRLLLH